MLRTTTRTGRAGARAVGVTAYFVVLLLLLATMAVSTVPGFRDEVGVVPLYDDWIQCTGYALAAGAVVWRLVVSPVRRDLWGWVATALVLRTLGFVYSIFVLDRAPDYPSLADLSWILSSLALLAGLLVATRAQAPRASGALALDAVLGGATAAAVTTTLLYGTVQRLAPAGVPGEVLATNLVYPLLDVCLLVVMVGLISFTRGRLPWATTMLCLGILAFATVDSVFLHQASLGTFRPGSFLTPLSLAGTVLIAMAAWLPGRPVRPPRTAAPSLAATVGLALVCLSVLAYDAVREVPAVGILLGSAGVLVAIVRGWLTFTGDRRETEVALADRDQQIERYQAMVEASEDFIAMSHLDGSMVYVNPAGLRMVGMAPDAAVDALVIDDFVHESTRDRPGLLETGSWRGESTLVDHRGGEPIPVTANTFVLRDPMTGEPWLLATVQHDISALQDAQRRSDRLAEDRQELLSHLVNAQEAERARIAADVHDDSVQAMAAVDLRLGLVQRRLEMGKDLEETQKTLRELRGIVGHANDRLRHLLFDLDSPAQREGLMTALREAAAFVLGDSVRWSVDGDTGPDLPETSRVLAYRIAKEALSNVRKHAQAERVTITVSQRDDGVLVVVADDGIGPPATGVQERPGHRGVPDMRDRAAVAGGWLRIEPGPEGGTRVLVWLPGSANAH